MAQSSHPCFISGSIFFIIKTKRIKRNRETIWIFVILCYTVFDGFFEKVKQWIPSVNGAGRKGECLSDLEIGVSYTAYTQTFMSFGAFETEEEANNCLKYVKTKFLRLLLGTLKVTQNNSKDTWGNISLQDFTDKSDIDWSKSVAEIDQQLYKTYNLDDSKIAFIESMIKPME